MKKSSFTALVLGVVSGMMFSVGICMALLPEWNLFQPGVIFIAMGLTLGVITIFLWRKMAGKGSLLTSGMTLLTIGVGIIGTLMLGIGLCICLVWHNLILGFLMGMIGIVALLFMIPMVKGFKD